MFKAMLIAITIFLAAMYFADASQYFSKAQLHPNCLKVKPTPSLSAEWGMRLFAGASFYIPFGNSKAIHHISELVSGTKVGDENEITQKMCLRVQIRGFKLSMESTGNHVLVQDCSVIKKGSNQCVVNGNSENPETQKHGDGIFNIVWTNNKDSMAIVRCTSDGLYNDWYVFSTNVNLNDTIKFTVLQKMNGLGFQHTLNDTVSPSYEGCELFKPEEDD